MSIPAFPAIPYKTNPDPQIGYPGGDTAFAHGMDLRDYFAAHALAGLMSRLPDMQKEFQNPQTISIDCYKVADAMLKAREA